MLCFSQTNEYSRWQQKMKNNGHLKEFLRVSIASKNKIDNNYYGNDFNLLKKIDKDCYVSQSKLSSCLKSLGFKKADEYSRDLFARTNSWGLFVKENPGFYKLSKELQLKLLLDFLKDISIPDFPI